MKDKAAEAFVGALKNAVIDFVSYLPETRLSGILPLLRRDSTFKVVPTTSEAEAVSIAAGAALAGRRPAVYMEGTGVYVSAYSLLTVGERFGVPMLLLVSYIGSFDDKMNSAAFSHYGKVDRLLESIGIEHRVVSRVEDLEEQMENAVRVMYSLKLPVALLFTGEFTR
ncbi:MAG TPA: thiamine pyrophosphate-binding protein [Candidatus Binatia bacterium]|jgi:sulfopyruvate decarboxylase TPP-binding subunit